MITVKTHFECEIAHRLFDVDTYSSECRDNVHGHSYKFDLEVGRTDGKELNEAGMVVDFKLLKETIKTFEKKYDHSVIVRERDPLKDPFLQNCKKVNVVEGNPTAEWMVSQFKTELNALFEERDLKVEVVQLQIAETTGNVAIWRK